MIKNKINKIILLLYFLVLNNYAHARIITVDECTIPFDFTIANICVLGTLGLWIIVPLIFIVVFGGFQIFIAIVRNIFSR